MEPVMQKDIPRFNIDYRGLVQYAKTVGKQVFELSDDEKNRFICGATMDDVREKMIRVK